MPILSSQKSSNIVFEDFRKKKFWTFCHTCFVCFLLFLSHHPCHREKNPAPQGPTRNGGWVGNRTGTEVETLLEALAFGLEKMVNLQSPKNLTFLKGLIKGNHMGVSKNRGFTPHIIHFKFGFSIINHPFWGTPSFGNTHMV